VPVIYLSGNSDETNKARSAKTNMLAFCVKPVHFEELKKVLSTVKY
jgi:DNA-binding response OmpR family regulator